MISPRQNYAFLFLAVFTALIVASCAGVKAKGAGSPHIPTSAAAQEIILSRNAAYAALKATDRSDTKRLAKQGIEYALQCLRRSPEEAACYYWRAVNTGLYYRARVIGYQDGVKQMISDCKKMIGLDPSYDFAGAYRILGQLYTKLPQTAAHAEGVTRDLQLAEGYLREAISLAPDYPENHLALAETLFEKDNIAAAAIELAKAKDLAPQWPGDVSYDDWKKTTRVLEKKIAKAKK